MRLRPPDAHLSPLACSMSASLIDALRRHRAEVLARWRESLDPDGSVLRHPSEATEPMAHVVDALFADLQRPAAEPMIAPETVFASAVHGSSRRQQGIGMDLVLREFDTLRHVMNAVLRGLSSAAPSELASRLDFAITTASLASLRGYHRDEFDALGQWPSTLDDLLRAENPWAVAGVAPARGGPARAAVGNGR
jgi:hypothetical protein